MKNIAPNKILIASDLSDEFFEKNIGNDRKIEIKNISSGSVTLNGYGFVKSTGGAITYVTGSSSQFVKANGSLDSNTYLTGINSSQVTTALGYTPYNSTNPSGFITSASLSPYLTITSASNLYQPIGNYLTAISGSMVITALGYTPYNATNPDGYITNSALSPYLTTVSASSLYQPIGSYLTSINGIVAGGELSGSYPNPSVTNSAVIGKVLTGYVSGGGTITSSDSILSAIQKLNGNIGGIVSGVSSVFGRTGVVVATNNDYSISQITNGLSNVLSSGKIFVGNGTNFATDVDMSGDSLINNSGSVTNVGIQGKPITLSNGFLKYNGLSWIFDNSTYLSSNQIITFSGSGDVTGVSSGSTTLYPNLTLSTITQGIGSNFVKINLDTKGRVIGNSAVTSSDINTTLGYTPYNSTNPNGYISSGSVASFYAPIFNPIFSGSVTIPTGVAENFSIDGTNSVLSIKDRAGSGNTWNIYAQGAGGKFRIYKNFAGYVDQTPFVIDGTTGYIGLNKSAPNYPVEMGGNTNINGGDLIITQLASLGGRIKIPLNAGVSKYLTSDSSGYGTWQTIPFSDLGSKPTTISGYGITDFNATGDVRYILRTELLSGSGFVKINSGNITFDNSTYLTSNQVITFSGSGDVIGISSGSTTLSPNLSLSTITQGVGSNFVKISLDTKGRVIGNTSVGSSDITTALGYTPYNSTNPNGYISSGSVASIYAPLNSPMFTGSIGINGSGSISNNGSSIDIQSNNLSTGGLKIGTSSSYPVNIYTSGSNKVTVGSNGNVNFSGSVFISGSLITPKITIDPINNVTTLTTTTNLFGSQTNDGTANQFLGDVRIKSTLNVVGLLSINDNFGLNNSQFITWKNSSNTTYYQMLGLSGINFLIGEYNNTLLGTINTYSANSAHIFRTNGVEKIRMTETGMGIDTTVPIAKLQVGGNVPLSWTSGVTANAVIGIGGTSGSSFFVNTPSLDSSYHSGLAIDGSYTNPSGIGTSIVNIKALGVYSGGGYDSNLSLSVTNGTSIIESVRIKSDGKVGFGTSTPLGVIDVSSTTQPSYPFPRMTTTQINAITGMSAGAFVFDITTNHPKYYNGSSWVQL